jgi:hypothetical protein
MLFIALTGQAFAQLAFSKVEGLRWPMSYDHVIVQLKQTADVDVFSTELKSLNGRIVRPLNKHRFYLVKFRNYSKTIEIFGRQIDRLRRISAIVDVLPVIQFTDKLISTDSYINSSVSGFSTFQNDSLFKEIGELKFSFSACYDKVFRLYPSRVHFAVVEFQIKDGRTSQLNILDSDVEGEELTCVTRVLEKQFWGVRSSVGLVRYLFIIKNEH